MSWLPVPEGDDLVGVDPHRDTEGPREPEVCQLDHLQTGEEGGKRRLSGAIWQVSGVTCQVSSV